MQETLRRALEFYKENRETVQLLVKTLNVSQSQSPSPSPPSAERESEQEEKESRPEVDFHQTILEQFLKTQTP